MLGFDKRAARSTWTAALVLLLLYVVYLARKTLFVFTLALLFAYVLAPLVNLLDRIFPARRTRTAALALAFVIVVAIVGALGYLLGVRVVDEASVLALRFPTMVESWQHPPPSDHSMRAQIAERVRSEVATRSQSLISELPAVWAAASGRSQQPHLRSDHTRPGVFLPEGRDDPCGGTFSICWRRARAARCSTT
jgi:predicted PurR-regulated permease PerM